RGDLLPPRGLRLGRPGREAALEPGTHGRMERLEHPPTLPPGSDIPPGTGVRACREALARPRQNSRERSRPRIVDRGRRQPITGPWSVVGMGPSADRYTPDDTADRPTSSAGS